MLTFEFILSRKGKGKANQMINSNDRLCPQAKASRAKILRQMAAKEQCNRKPFSKTNPCYIIAVIHPPTDRRMDAPNWYPTIKPLIDGLTDAGWFTDDNNKIITGVIFLPGQKTNDGKYHIELHVKSGRLSRQMLEQL